MSYRFPFALLGFLLSFSVSSQSITSDFLQQKLQNNPSKTQRIQIYLRDRLDTRELNRQFDQNSIPTQERIQSLNLSLKSKAENAQGPIVEFIKNRLGNSDGSAAIIQQFHIINMMIVDANPSLIEELSSLPQVEHIESNERFFITPIPIIEKHQATSRVVGGHEPGLEAIHAPFMWNLGYTGLGRKLFTCDTGVWPIHPAIKRQFRGNYLPESWCWKGFDSETPADKPDAHGTHVTGTVLGLDTLNSDTIGVAFNASYLAADPIVENAADIKPVSVIFEAFQFAINPDGNDLTSEDVPDVICNSWGIGDSIASGLCTAPFIVDLFSALDVAGIAVEFSAGNEGPGAGTISLPQYVTFDSLSIFTVGALNGASSSLPIASFSSRGPTACDVQESWKIKPEVSAPGVNVRSSVQWNQYAEYSGTSMAGPHVAGAVLLLKEAFPMLNGRQLLNALYQTATDLGDIGEDNIYGRGIINLEAAYNFLAAQYTPVPPNTSPFDISIESILGNGFSCAGNFIPQVVIRNVGTQEIGLGQVDWNIDGQFVGYNSWDSTLQPGQRDTLSLSTGILTSGRHEIQANIICFGNFIERDLLNNSRISHVYVQPTVELPYAESFENTDLTSNNLLKFNYDNSKTWDTTHTAGLTNSFYSARMPFLGYSNRKQLDDLITPRVNVPNNLDSLFLRFDLAYRYRNPTLSDTLDIEVSNTCGESWTSIFRKGGEELATFDTVWTNFRPFTAAHWKTHKLDLLPYSSTGSVMVRFRGINGSGTSLFLDNIGIYSASDPTLIENISLQASIFPNPTQDNITIKLGQTGQNVQVDIIDLQGRIIKQDEINKNQDQIQLSLASLQTGIYFVRLVSKNGNAIKRIVVQ
jgi:bacillopeptidase F